MQTGIFFEDTVYFSGAAQKDVGNIKLIEEYLNSSTTPIEMTKLNHMDEISGRVPTFVRRLIV